jgi:hypothetical protein
MSHHDEFQDLEEQLRQHRPATEALPAAFKHRLRAQLVEQDMNRATRILLPPLRLALGGLALLLVPFLFWLWLRGLQQGASNPAISAPIRQVPAATIIEQSPAAAVADEVEVIAAYPSPQTLLSGERATVTILAAYDLNSTDRAELILRLNEAVDETGGRGVVSASRVITRGHGVVALPLTINPAELTQATLSLNVLLRDPSAEAERLLFLDFPQSYEWLIGPAGNVAAARHAEAAVLGAGRPQPFADGRLVPGADGYQVEVFVAYDLADYEEGYLTLGYEVDGPRSSSGGATSQWISGLEPDFFNEDGSFRDEVTFSLELAGFDPATGESLILFPEEAIRAQQEMPEHLDIQSVRLSQDESGRPALEVNLWYERKAAVTATITVTVEAGQGPPVAQVAIPISQQRDSVSVLLPVDLNEYTADLLLRMTATLETAAETLLAEFPLQVGSLMTQRMNEVWLISAGWQTATIQIGDLPYQMDLVVGYALSEDYQYGQLSVTAEQRPAGNASGGGSGGGAYTVEPGAGSFHFSVPLNQPFSPESGQEWPAGLSLQIELRGVSADGTEKVLSTWSRPAGP